MDIRSAAICVLISFEINVFSSGSHYLISYNFFMAHNYCKPQKQNMAVANQWQQQALRWISRFSHPQLVYLHTKLKQ